MFAKRIIPCLDVNNGRVVKEQALSTSAMPETRLKRLLLTTGRARMN